MNLPTADTWRDIMTQAEAQIEEIKVLVASKLWNRRDLNKFAQAIDLHNETIAICKRNLGIPA